MLALICFSKNFPHFQWNTHENTVSVEKTHENLVLHPHTIIRIVSSKTRHLSNRLLQFSSVAQLTCDSMDHSTPGLPVHHQPLEFTQTHVHWVGDAIQPSHTLSSSSPPTFNLFQHQGLFKWVSSSYQVAKVLEFQLQHQSFQWILRTDFL